jgi:IS1 family transposase
LSIGNIISKPLYGECNEEYELDEMTVTIAGKKDIFLIYAINRRTRQVIDFFIGNRTKENITRVVDSVLSYSPKTVFTDRLNSYPALIPKEIHRPGRRLTNRIERKNLTLRNFIKRLSRSTLCFTRSIKMLETCLRIYLWSGI